MASILWRPISTAPAVTVEDLTDPDEWLMPYLIFRPDAVGTERFAVVAGEPPADAALWCPIFVPVTAGTSLDNLAQTDGAPFEG